MLRTRVKICGITRPEDGRCAVENGVDAIGLVFFPESPRCITADSATEITGALDPFVTVVGLFVNASQAEIKGVLGQVPLDLLQFHGQESNEDCIGYGLPFIKSIAMEPGVDIAKAMAAYPDARGFLLDAWQPQIHGGGGEAFDWQQIPRELPSPFILAGGLTPENVGTAIRRVRPYAVDVSSGVESAPGIKSAVKITAFMNGVRNSGTDTVK
ncbi:MAG: phosphoribosylanthranilate isomerase [Gammaproteobacteria bacterium]|nr:MAG: phosphoribosylanthranilate isomerase [Gammaproteobacteria bacterium]